ncbi:MAG: alpha/beta hydrolase [Pseudomonadota bacterium]
MSTINRRAALAFPVWAGASVLGSCRAPDPEPAPPGRAFVETSHGRLHARRIGNGARTPLVMLHMLPFSGAHMLPVAERLGNDRTVLMLDLPGCGQSRDAGPDETVEAVADAMAEAAEACFGAAIFHIAGFHTGALVALELASRTDSPVRRAVLAGIPFYEGEERDALAARSEPRVLETPEAMADYARLIHGFLGERVTPERRYALTLDALRCAPDQHHLVSMVARYEAGAALERLDRPALAPVLDEMLQNQTRAAAERSTALTALERVDLKGDAWDVAPDAIAQMIGAFIDAD